MCCQVLNLINRTNVCTKTIFKLKQQKKKKNQLKMKSNEENAEETHTVDWMEKTGF